MKQFGKRSKYGALPKALVGDERRQASALFKGVDFQIWLTIASWINLDEEQILVIEGVEDFDVVSKDGGITTQAKAITRPIGLGGATVAEALRNFWQSKHSNPGRKVQYCFVTTAPIAIESGEPFGAGAAGLTLWSREAQIEHPTETTEKLRRFLVENEAVRNRLGEPFSVNIPSLVGFLQSSNAETFFREVIRPIRWMPNQDGVEAAKSMVAIQLHAYGEKRDIMTGDCDRALAHLFAFVAHKAVKEHRTLTREDFRLEFERAVSPGPREVAQLKLAVTLARKAFGQSDAHASALLNTTSPLDVPRLPSLCLERQGLVVETKSSLNATGFAALHGSTGKGKSTLAKLAIGASAGSWTWFSFVGMDTDRVIAGLDRAAMFAATTNTPCLVLDNFDVPSLAEPRFATKLVSLFLLATSRGGQIIVTAQRKLPAMFLRETGLPDSVLLAIPNLIKEEIQDLCRQAGCPEGQQLLAHAAIVFAQTSGHPQLVNAAVSTRREQGWPTPSANQILEQAPEIIEERKLAQQLLDGISVGEVELLSRLSLLSISFRRDQAITIAEIEPCIVHPGNCFDKLVGPWIEPASGNRYRLSSLLNQVAADNYSTDRITELRGKIGRAILRSGNLTQSEAHEILMQAVVIKDPALALPVLKTLYLAPEKQRKFWADALWWMLAFTETKAIFPTDEMVTHLFHHVQFRMAVASNHKRAVELAETLMNEVDELKTAKAQELIVAGVACDILLALKSLIPPKLLLRCWTSTVSVLTTSTFFSDFARKIEQKRPGRFRMQQQSFSEMFFGFILCRRGGRDFLSQFLNAVDELNEIDHTLVVSALRANELRLRLFVDRAWIQEGAKPNPEWDKVIAVLREVWDAGKRWQFPGMLTIAARGIAIVYDEYLNQQGEALKILDLGAKEIGSDVTLLRYQRGNIFFRSDRNQDAYDQWVTVLPEMKTDDVESAVDALYAFSKYADVAGRLRRWDEAAKIFLEGRKVAASNKLRMEATAFGVDAAHAMWFGGKRAESLSLFATCLDELESQSGNKEPDGFHTLWKVTEQIVHWCAMNAGAPGQTFELTRAGLCSESKDDERHKLVKNRPRAPMILIWIFLAEAELYANLGSAIYSRLLSRPDGASFAGARAIKAFLVHRRAFHDREFSSLPELVEEIAIAEAITKGKSAQNFFAYCPNPKIPEDISIYVSKFAVEAFPAALLSMAADGKDWRGTLNEWRTSAKRAVTNYDFETLLNRIETVMQLSPDAAAKFYKTAENRIDQLLIYVRLATSPDSPLSACFVGCVNLVTDEALIKGYMGEGEILGNLTRDIWRKRLSFKAEFNVARILVPAIELACNQPFKGTKLAAHILLAARSAVRTSVPENMLATLHRLAGASG